MKKYTFTNESIQINEHILYRIQALRSFGTVTEGDLGGFIESESNLSHDGECWVDGNARVYDNAWV